MLALALALALLADPQVGKPVTGLPPLVPDAQAVSPDRRRIAISTRERGVWLLELASGRLMQILPPTSSQVEALAWSPDSALLGMLHRNALIELVHAASGRVSATALSVPNDQERRGNRVLQFAAGGSVLVVALNGPTTDLFRVEDGSLIARLGPSNDSFRTAATAFAISPDGETLALGNKSHQVRLWRTRTGESLPDACKVPAGHGWAGVHALAFDPQGKRLAIGSSDCSVRVWHIGSDHPLLVLSHCESDIFGDLAISDVEFSPDGRRLLSASFPWWELRVWDLDVEKPLVWCEYRGGGPAPMHAWFAGDGHGLVGSLGARYLPLSCEQPEAKIVAVHAQTIPGGVPKAEDWAWWQHDGDYAWAVVDRHLVVRKIPVEEPVLSLPARER